jgi:TP901 family phage tail tape measure protein
MADRLKGITIEIGGDTSGLSAALKGVNTEISRTQSALKDTERLLKIDPGNITLLKQKQAELSKEIEQTTNKLKSLKDKEGDMSAALSSGKITQEQYDSYQREIIDTEQKLDKLKDSQKSFGNVASASMSAASSAIKDTGDKIGNVGESMTKNVTAPIVAVGGAALASFSTVDEAMDTVAKKTGASGDALKDLKDVASDIATSMPTDFATAGNAVGEVNTRFKATGDQLNDLSTEFIKFGEINDTDVSQSVDNASMVMQQFGLTTDDTAGLLGQITAVSQDTGVSVDKLMGDLQNSGSAMRSMGLDASQSVTLLGNFSKAGIDSETALKAMSKAAQNYSKDGTNVAEGMTTLVAGVKDGTISYSELADVVGTKNALAFSDMAKSGRLSLDNLGTSLSDYSSTVSTTFANTEDPIDSAKTAMNSLLAAGAELGASIGTVLAPILKQISATLKNVKNAFDGMSPTMQQAIVKVALVAAAIGPLLVAVKGLFSGISSIASGLSVLMAHPIIASIVAVIAVIALLWTKCEWFRNLVTGAFNVIKTVAETVWNAISTVITTVWNTVKSVWDACQPFFEALWNAIITVAKPIWEAIVLAISVAWYTIKGVWDVVSPFFSALWNGIMAVAQPVWDGISSFVTGAWDTIKGVWDGVSGFFQGVWDGISEPVEGIWNGVKDTFSGAIDWIKNLFNFDWHWPSIPLPHFSFNGSLNPLDWFDQGVPTFNVDWYDRGGIFSSPSLIGVGEKRPEFVGALDDLRKIVREESGSDAGIGTVNITVNPSAGMNERDIAQYTIDLLQKQVDQKRNAFGK